MWVTVYVYRQCDEIINSIKLQEAPPPLAPPKIITVTFEPRRIHAINVGHCTESF